MSFFSSLLTGLTKSGANQPVQIYLQCNGKRIQFPIAPSSFEVNVKQNNSIVNINNLGQLNMIGKTGLMTISLSSFFPAQDYNFNQSIVDEPYSYVKNIDGFRTSGKPSRLIISNTPFNYPVTIDSFNWGEKDGSGDVYFTLDCKEYKFIGDSVDNTQISSISGLKERSSFLEDVAKTVTVYPSDSLMDVVGRTLGTTTKLSSTDNKYLDFYKTMAKAGGIKTGSILSVKDTVVKIGDENVFK